MSKDSSRARRAFALLALAAAVAVPAALAGDRGVELVGTSPAAPSGGAIVDETPNAYFVEFSGSKADFAAQAKASGVKYTERFTFGRLFNGMSLTIAPGERGKLGGLSSVKAVWPVYAARLAPTSAPELGTAVAMTGADIANSSGYDGTGVKVAIMDTGVDYNHPDLGGSGVDGDAASNDGVFDGDFPGSRVVAGWDFVGDAFNADPTAPSYNPIATPDPDPDDCHSHGTHVAGIVGAKAATSSGTNGVTGVAPAVKFGAYRVFGCEGSTTADIMLAAMERALADGMHVLNMSIGSAFMTWPQYPTAAGADALVDAGMVVVASIGNSGGSGLYSAGAPGVGNNVIGTASFDNSHVALSTFTVSPAGLTAGYANAASAPAAPTSGSGQLSAPSPMTGCAAANFAGFPAGSIALIQRGGCTFHAKALNAQNAGASAVVLYNNSAGRFSPTVAGTPAITIPVVAISDTEGAAIAAAMGGGTQTLNWQAGTGTFVNPTGGLISSFSSFGLNAELTLKPDIGGPGGLIRSTYPLELGSYATISGTSMSSPHVAGAAALLRQARPTMAASQFRTVLQNSADPKAWWGNPGLGFLDNVHRQGAGMVDVDDAIASTTTVSPGKISLGEGAGGSATLTIANRGSSAETYALSHAPALSTGPNTFTPSYVTGFASVAFSASSVTVAAGGTGSVTATITSNPGLADKSMYGGYLVLTRESDGQVFRVPYAGFQGDYQSIQALAPTPHGFPWVAKLAGTSYTKQSDGAVFTLQGGDIPYVLLHLDHQARRFELEIVDAATGARLHPVFSNALEQDYLSRNSTSTGFFAFPWDGGRLHSNGQGSKAGLAWKTVPNGTYKLNVKVLKALGDAANPAHWETWTSPAITLARP